MRLIKALQVLTVISMGYHAARAQGPVSPVKLYESQVVYQKTQQVATMIDLPYPPDIVESAIKDYMGKYGYKGSGSRGYTVFRNVKLDADHSQPNDIHVKVEKRNRRESNSSIVTVLTARPTEDLATRTGKDSFATDRSRTAEFMQKMVPFIQSADLEDRIKTQEKDTKKVEGKLADLRDDQVSLEKKIRDGKQDLEDNNKDQLSETKEMKSNVVSNDPKATAKSHKRMDKLLSQQASLQKKLDKNTESLEQNKKLQETQQASVQQQQRALDSLKSMRKN